MEVLYIFFLIKQVIFRFFLYKEIFKFNLRHIYIVATAFYLILYTMTTKQRKHFATMLGICSVITILWWCQNKTEVIGTTTTNPTIIEAGDTSAIEENRAKNNETIAPQGQKLSINNRCIGCGHCVNIAGNSFSMAGRVAEVISQEDIDSSSVAQAIARCPVDAIEIIEV